MADKPSLRLLDTSGNTRRAIVHQRRLKEGVELPSKPYCPADLATRVGDILKKR